MSDIIGRLRSAYANGDPSKYLAMITVKEAHEIAASLELKQQADNRLFAMAVEYRLQRDELASVVQAFIDQEVDYMTLNKLGDPEKQHNVKWGRSVLQGMTPSIPLPHLTNTRETR